MTLCESLQNLVKNEKEFSNKNHEIVIRVKRKRNEEPLDLLLVESSSAAKKQNTSSSLHQVTTALENLSTTPTKSRQHESDTTCQEKRFIFTRMDTLDKKEVPFLCHRRVKKSLLLQKHSKKKVESYLNQFLQTNRQHSNFNTKNKRFQEIQNTRQRIVTSNTTSFHVDKNQVQGNGICIVDVAPILMEEEQKEIHNSNNSSNSSNSSSQCFKVRKPEERLMDQGILQAFELKDFSTCFELIRHNNISVDFQRSQDGRTTLMAAAYHERVDIIDFLLARGAKVGIVDAQNQSAADYALLQGNHAIAKAFLASSQVEMDNEYVYDVYYLDPTTQQETTVQKIQDAGIPIVQLNSFQDDEIGCLGFDMKDDDQDDHENEEDEDSNCEDYIANDYPDEEDSSDNSSSDYEQQTRMSMGNEQHHHPYSVVDYDDDEEISKRRNSTTAFWEEDNNTSDDEASDLDTDQVDKLQHYEKRWTADY